MVLCDLPFGVTRHKWDSVIPFIPLWQSYARVCKPAANIVLFAIQPFAAALIASKPTWFRYDLIWEKNKPTGFLNANRRPLAKHEAILVFRMQGSGFYHPQKTAGHPPMHAVNNGKHFGDATYGSHYKAATRGGSTERFPTSVLHFPRVNNDDPHRVHPNQKPVALLENLIRTYSTDGDTILDNTMGSGSTGLASIRCGRNFIGIENDPEYFDAAEEWLLSASCPEFPGWNQFDRIIPPANSQK
jgi:site-specific DNA-methyltransferase (adenine-specific)